MLLSTPLPIYLTGGATTLTKPHIIIYYCNGCRWLPRASWMAQELLTTFAEELGEVSLRPGTSGQSDIRLNEQTIWSRKRDGGFPELKPIKQCIRDHIAPEKSLGHSDRSCGPLDCDTGKPAE